MFHHNFVQRGVEHPPVLYGTYNREGDESWGDQLVHDSCFRLFPVTNLVETQTREETLWNLGYLARSDSSL
jgi:hypothetical protein